MCAQINLISKICLGTVQFGLDYGIANDHGKVAREEVFKILSYARDIGVGTLDTSVAYGESEQAIGEFIAQTQAPFNIVSKLLLGPGFFDSQRIVFELRESLGRLNVKTLYGCLVHRFEDFGEHPELWEILQEFRQKKIVGKIGFSLYRPQELEQLLDRGISFDILQIPFSVLDQRFEKYLRLLKEQNVEVHVRSVFLQGLVFLEPNELPQELHGASESISALQQIARAQGISVSALCVNAVLLNPLIDKVVVGIDSLEHLKQNIADLSKLDQVRRLENDLKRLVLFDENILLPFNWPQ